MGEATDRGDEGLVSVRVTVSETLGVPVGTKVLMAPTGETVGFLLPNGDRLKVWVAYELDNGDGQERDLTYDDLAARGVWQELDIERTIDDNGELDEADLVDGETI